MSRILSWSAVAWGLAMAVFAPHPSSAATNISSQTSSAPLPPGALVQLSPMLQPQVIGSFGFVFANGPDTAVITPDNKYMYVLANTSQNNSIGTNKILIYRINSNGTLTATGNPQAGQDTNGTTLYVADQGKILLTLDTDGSSPSAATAPFEVFIIHTDGSLSLAPNTIHLDPLTVSGPAALGSQAVDGSGQYVYAAIIDNNPNDSNYLMSAGYSIFKIAADGTLNPVNHHNFVLTPQGQPVWLNILNILVNGEFLCAFGDAGAYVSTIGANGNPPIGEPPRFTPYNDDNFFGDAFFGMEISPGGQNFYAVDSPDGNITSLGICHYPMNSDGTIQFTSKTCQTIFSSVLSGEAFGANGLYISPDNNFLYSLFQSEVGPTCSASMYAYAINSDASLGPLNFSSASPANSLPIGDNFCSDAFIGGTPDGSHVYAFGVEGQSNAIVPFRINQGLTSAAPSITRMVADVRGLRLPQSIDLSLIARLEAAQQNLDAGRFEAACGSLGAFVTAVDAQNRKKFDAAEAAKLIAEATAISESVGCRRAVR